MKISTTQKLFITLIFFTISISVFSQDTIITNQKDTILCKITKITENEILFNLNFENKIRKMKLPKTSIFDYKVNRDTNSLANDWFFYKYRLAFNGGLNYRTSPYDSNISSEEKAAIEKLRKGALLGVEMLYYPLKNFGLGVKYSYMMTLEKPIYVNYLAAKADFQLTSENRKHFLHLYGSAGYMNYIEHISQDGIMKFTAGTLGISCGMGYDFLIVDRFAIGMDIAYVLGGFSSIKISNGIDSKIIDLKEHPEGLNRVDFSIGIRFIR